MKYLVLLLVLAVVIGVWRAQRPAAPRPAARPAPGTPPAPQDMVACAHCGVHLPRADALVHGPHAYCCAEHRSLGPHA